MRCLFLFALCFASNFLLAQDRKPGSFYLSSSGNDDDIGNSQHPWKTLDKLNSIRLSGGDTVFLKGGETFTGTLVLDSIDRGRPGKPLVIMSSGGPKAIIDGGNNEAIRVYLTQDIEIFNIICKGSGRKSGNTQNGCGVIFSNNILIRGLQISGFQKSGLVVYESGKVRVLDVHSTENGFAGISVDAPYGTRLSKNVYIGNCIAENNPGDPTNLDNHSGNGIIIGNSRNVMVENCIATNNGWDMPRKGNGPVGIWCYEADSITFRSCISYRNKTSAGAFDGGGFDFDGGITNSVMENCLSFENQGSGYGIFQYDGASPWRNNFVRNSISINDGNTIKMGGSVYIWNGMKDIKQMDGLSFSKNILVNDSGSIIVYNEDNLHAGFQFYKNRFISPNPHVRGKDSAATDRFYRNKSGKSIDLQKFPPPVDPGKIKKYYKLLRRKT